MATENSLDDFNLKIAVVGVGGGGSNAINFMVAESKKNSSKYDVNEEGAKIKSTDQFKGVEFIACNTDMQALNASLANKKIQIGPNITAGLGAGANPEIGKKAAEESIDTIMEALDNVHLLILTAGMGGGTGTHGISVIAKHAKERNILTIAIVTKPFHFEGTRRMKIADEGIKSLKEHVDTLLIINNENLFSISNIDTGFQQAFQLTDKVLYSAVNIFTRVITGQGVVNLDFSDIRTTVKNMKGKAMIGEGIASGDRRAEEAAELAIRAPLLDDVELKNPKSILIYIVGGSDLKFWEINDAISTIKQTILSPESSDDVNIIFGVTQDVDLNDGTLQVFVIATGIDDKIPTLPKEEKKVEDEEIDYVQDRTIISSHHSSDNNYLDQIDQELRETTKTETNTKGRSWWSIFSSSENKTYDSDNDMPKIFKHKRKKK